MLRGVTRVLLARDSRWETGLSLLIYWQTRPWGEAIDVKLDSKLRVGRRVKGL